ncbi:hypothetical protein RvY_11505 [Ramazzottius varieornatus]|uniref:TGF-beta family profile domain-containing protein n=1 Tax=Ramazzottius varieornatus TaxID=947166 RepID=A0A1D1VGE1_RAMVA|nr:hypothetical protein RvY_11505 [Ramazzottius varieornatus]
MDLFYFRSRLRKSWLSWILSILTVCWRIRSVLPDPSAATAQSGLSHAAVPPRTSGQYFPSDSHETIPPPPRLDREKIKKVEATFLNLLGMKSRPKLTYEKQHIPAVMLELYQQQMRRHLPQNTNGESVNVVTKAKKKKKVAEHVWNTVRHYPHVQDVEEEQLRLDEMEGHKEFLWFNMSNIPLDDEIKVAELRLFVDSTWSNSLPLDTDVTQSTSSSDASNALRHNRRLLLRVHEILEVIDGEVITRPLDSRLVDVTNRSKTIVLDILPAVQRWQLSPSDNRGLDIEILTPDGRPLHHEIFSEEAIEMVNPLRTRRMRRSIGENQTEGESRRPVMMKNTYPDQNSVSPSDALQPVKRWHSPKDKQPHVLVYSDDVRAIKARGDKTRKAPFRAPRRKNTCKRHPMTVIFEEVGWDDWIIQPYQYEAFFCAGECTFPFADHINASNHATIQSLVHNANFQIVPKPCCIPTDMRPMTLMYNDEGGTLSVKNYEDMIVEGCGCR